MWLDKRNTRLLFFDPLEQGAGFNIYWEKDFPLSLEELITEFPLSQVVSITACGATLIFRQ
jgi:hypothetical protein